VVTRRHGASSRAVNNRRSAAHLPVAGPQPRGSRGRWCHPGLHRQPAETVTPAPAGSERRAPYRWPVTKRVP